MISTIGWIGAGIMGRPMASHLLQAGYKLVVPERKSPGVAALLELGAHTAATPQAVAEMADVVITMLPETSVVEDVLFGPDGLHAGLRPGTLFVDMSTIAPASARRTAQELLERGVAALDAPVSGGEQGALQAALSIMVGGTPDAFNRAEPLLRLLGDIVVHMGDAGTGQIAKACNQIAVAMTIEAVAEALALAEAAGADAVQVRKALMGGLAASCVLERYGSRMLEGRYEPGARARLHRKDLAIAAELAASAAIELPGLQLMLQQFTNLVARDGELDHSAIRVLLSAQQPR